MTARQDFGRPLFVVVSAPSGAGKSTLCDMLLAEYPSIVYSVSCTTRAPRGTEQDGRDYFFLTEDEFERRVRDGLFLEHAEVHGYRYGTLRETVNRALEDGHSVLLDIDVQGARRIRDYVDGSSGDDAIRIGFTDVFIVPPSMETLRERLTGRGEDAADVVERRLENALGEMACRDEFTHVVVNDELDEACARLVQVLEKVAGRG